jgi:hypothetical protein
MILSLKIEAPRIAGSISVCPKGGDAKGEIDFVGELFLPIWAGIIFTLSRDIYRKEEHHV